MSLAQQEMCLMNMNDFEYKSPCTQVILDHNDRVRAYLLAADIKGWDESQIRAVPLLRRGDGDLRLVVMYNAAATAQDIAAVEASLLRNSGVRGISVALCHIKSKGSAALSQGRSDLRSPACPRS